jgi:hypothetical protein
MLALKERLPVLLHEPQQASTRFRFAKDPWLPLGRLRTLFFLRDLPVSGNQLQSLRGVFSYRVAGPA